MGNILIDKPALNHENSDVWSISVEGFQPNSTYMRNVTVLTDYSPDSVFNGSLPIISHIKGKKVDEIYQYLELFLGDMIDDENIKLKWEKENILDDPNILSQITWDEVLRQFAELCFIDTSVPIFSIFSSPFYFITSEGISLEIKLIPNFTVGNMYLTEYIKKIRTIEPSNFYISVPTGLMSFSNVAYTDNKEKDIELNKNILQERTIIYFYNGLSRTYDKEYPIDIDYTKVFLTSRFSDWKPILTPNQVFIPKGIVPISGDFSFINEKEGFPTFWPSGQWSIDEYSKTIDVFTPACLSGDTQIQINEKGDTKPIKEIQKGEYVWTPKGLEKVIYSDCFENKKANHYYLFTLENGVELKIIKNHRFFNPKTKKFEHILNRKVGDYLLDNKGNNVKIVKIELINETINHYTIFTENTNQYYANTMLAGNIIANLPLKWIRKTGLIFLKHYYNW